MDDEAARMRTPEGWRAYWLGHAETTKAAAVHWAAEEVKAREENRRRIPRGLWRANEDAPLPSAEECAENIATCQRTIANILRLASRAEEAPLFAVIALAIRDILSDCEADPDPWESAVDVADTLRSAGISLVLEGTTYG